MVMEFQTLLPAKDIMRTMVMIPVPLNQQRFIGLSWYPAKLHAGYHLIDDNSGIGLSFVVKDINKDRLPDIIISNKKGIFYFENVKN